MVCAMFFVTLSSGLALSAEEVTLIGTVDDYYQIVTDDGEAYEIGDNEQGDEVTGYVGARVKVRGILEENEDVKTITILSYEVLDEGMDEVTDEEYQEDIEEFPEE